MRTARSLTVCGSLFAACLLAALSARAADDKTLQNMKGTVSWRAGTAAAHAVAPNATTVLDDSDYAITGADSLAGIGLPDSSRVLVGSASSVQLGAFDQAAGTTAKFVVVGKVRFIVEHPKGAKANYTFQTPTGSISVRGTEGDIYASGDELHVNVYEVCDPAEPVVFTSSSGQSFQLVAGQSLGAHLVNGIVQAEVHQITQEMIDRFSPDFGVPTSWDAAKGEIVGRASGALDNATGGYGSQVAGAVSGLFGHKSAPTPSPTPASTSCSHE
jgi:ferric-dicitrate binding protein FerR (iron transport regulator)